MVKKKTSFYYNKQIFIFNIIFHANNSLFHRFTHWKLQWKFHIKIQLLPARHVDLLIKPRVCSRAQNKLIYNMPLVRMSWKNKINVFLICSDLSVALLVHHVFSSVNMVTLVSLLKIIILHWKPSIFFFTVNH